MMLINFENELLSDWVNEMKFKKNDYVEPLICQSTVNIVKLACTTFNQDIHVLIMSIDMLEDYVRRKIIKNEEITEGALLVAAIVFMSSKYMGGQDLKVQYITKFLNKITGKEYNGKIVKLTEMTILKTLDNKLPVITTVDDLNAFITKFERECRMKISVRPLCLHILEALYITRDRWFFELKTVYVQSEEALNVFKSLMSSRFFLPLGILLYALLHTNYRYFINVDSIIEELTRRLHIHADHVNLLVSKIHEIMKME